MVSNITITMMCQMLIRTFISIDVPITEEISSLLDSLRDIRGIRVPPEGQMHLTLKFLGDTDDKKGTKLCASLREALLNASSFNVNIEGLGAFPNERNPRVLWMGVKEPERLIRIAEIVNDTVKSLNIKCDDKKFSPHITVGRIDGRPDLKDVFKNNKERRFCSFRCSSVKIMKSELTPKGAIHSVIDSIGLN